MDSFVNFFYQLHDSIFLRNLEFIVAILFFIQSTFLRRKYFSKLIAFLWLQNIFLLIYYSILPEYLLTITEFTIGSLILSILCIWSLSFTTSYTNILKDQRIQKTLEKAYQYYSTRQQLNALIEYPVLNEILIIVVSNNEGKQLNNFLKENPKKLLIKNQSGDIITMPISYLVIDNHSSDETYNYCNSHKTFYLRTPYKITIDEAFYLGMEFAKKQQYLYILTMDINVQYNMEILKSLCLPLINNNTHLILAGAEFNPNIKIHFMNFMIRFLTGKYPQDIFTITRAMSLQTILNFKIKYPNYATMSLFLYAIKYKIPIQDIILPNITTQKYQYSFIYFFKSMLAIWQRT